MKKIFVLSLFSLFFVFTFLCTNVINSQGLNSFNSKIQIHAVKSVNGILTDTTISQLEEHLFPQQSFISYIYYMVNPGHTSHSANMILTQPVSWCTLSNNKFTSDTCSDVHAVLVTFNAPAALGNYTTAIRDSNGYWPDLPVKLTVTNTPSLYTDDSTVTIYSGQSTVRYQVIAWLGFNWTVTNYCGPNPYVPSNQTTVTYSLHSVVPWLTINPLVYNLTLNNPVTVQKQFSYNTIGTFSTYEMRAATWFTWPGYIHWTLIVNPIGIQKISSEIPKYFKLYDNYPNPFNSVTKFKVDIARFGNVKLVIYNVLGRVITTLVNEHLIPGRYEVEWDGTNYPSGVYFYKLITGDYSETNKMVLIK